MSLKFSLGLITDALKEFAGEITAKTRLIPQDKTLQILLVHMDEQSHVLQAFFDTPDLTSIRENFCKNGLSKLEEWGKYCLTSKIILAVPNLCRIDYIPPRVGILIDYDDADDNQNCVLYAGRCAFGKLGPGLRLVRGGVGILLLQSTR